MRNGYCAATVKTTAGPVTVTRLKLRGTTDRFVSALFGKLVTRSNALEALVIAGFVRGLSVRDGRTPWRMRLALRLPCRSRRSRGSARRSVMSSPPGRAGAWTASSWTTCVPRHAAGRTAPPGAWPDARPAPPHRQLVPAKRVGGGGAAVLDRGRAWRLPHGAPGSPQLPWHMGHSHEARSAHSEPGWASCACMVGGGSGGTVQRAARSTNNESRTNGIAAAAVCAAAAMASQMTAITQMNANGRGGACSSRAGAVHESASWSPWPGIRQAGRSAVSSRKSPHVLAV
jgi:hypothetical protein